MKTLVTFAKDWADEFSAEGFDILTPEQVVSLKEALPTLEYYFGTNEGWEEGEIVESDFTFTEITDEEEATLLKLFPDLQYPYGVGQFPSSVY